jgi:hypothetical protein
MPGFSLTSHLKVAPDALWRACSTLDGVNREFAPLLRMTCPKAFRGRSLAEAPLGTRAFRSWLLLFGVLPVDYDDLCLVKVVDGEGFSERSSMLSMRQWHHDRWIHATPQGCQITDTVAFEPRVPGTGLLLLQISNAMFRFRHWKLRRQFGRIVD